ncbi:MAG TPA: hypothetical protein VJP79_08470 [Nitrososphaera sp.]|nr:hypothetical protein [Nitrososphaera sp.]
MTQRILTLAILVAAVLVGQAAAVIPTTTNAYAQERGPTKQEIVDANYSGPIVQDAFWTDRTSSPPANESLQKVEVAPGDGASVLAVIFVNRGLSEITSVAGRLDMPAGFRASSGNSQAVATHDTIVEPGATFTLFFEMDVLNSARVQGYDAPLTVTYSKILEVGQYRSVELSVPFRLTGKVILDAMAVDREIVPGSANSVGISISNKGTATATAVVVTVTPANAANGSTSAVSIGQNTFEIGSIAANTTSEIHPTIYAANTAAEAPQTVNVQISYGNAYGIKQTSAIPVGLIVLPRALESDIGVSLGENSSSTILTAGKIYDYKFVLSNTVDNPLSDVLITLRSQSDSIKILGESEWTVKQMDVGYRQEFATQVFAPTSLIGESTNFDLNLRYLSEGQTETDSVDLGAYIDGEISIRAYEIEVNYIGGTPNIVGNLLNEGNTVALFTTIEIVNAGGLVTTLPPQQYLGDLEENSPLPFSIPVNVGGAQAGSYPVDIRVTYKDNLRQLHTLDFNSNVQFAPEVSADESSQGQGMNMGVIPIVVIAVIVVAAIAAVVIIRRRKKSSLRQAMSARKQDDIESLLDSQRQDKKG